MTIKNKLSIATLFGAVCMSFSAWAISLDDAKSQGLVGENSSGYLGLVVPVSYTHLTLPTTPYV